MHDGILIHIWWQHLHQINIIVTNMLCLYYLFFGNGSKIKYGYKSGFYFTFIALSQILTFQISHLRCTLIVICAIESVQSVDNQFRERKTSGLAKKTELHSISLFYYLQDLQKQKKREGEWSFSKWRRIIPLFW